MPDMIAVCNNALSDIQLSPIVSFQDGSTRANLCRDKFPAARDAVLSLHPWNFATTHRVLPAQPDEERVTLQWAYQYQLPHLPYCLHVFAAGPGTDVHFSIGADPVHGRILWSDEGPTLDITFTWRVEDTTAWSALAVKVLEKWLAAELAPLSSSPRANKETLLKEAYTLIPQAEASDASEGKPVVLSPNNTLLHARWGGHLWGKGRESTTP